MYAYKLVCIKYILKSAFSIPLSLSYMKTSLIFTFNGLVLLNMNSTTSLSEGFCFGRGFVWLVSRVFRDQGISELLIS